MQVIHDSDGPWHEGFAQSFECQGQYCTVVCGNPEVAAAIAEYFDPRPRLAPDHVIVGRVCRPTRKERREVAGS